MDLYDWFCGPGSHLKNKLKMFWIRDSFRLTWKMQQKGLFWVIFLFLFVIWFSNIFFIYNWNKIYIKNFLFQLVTFLILFNLMA